MGLFDRLYKVVQDKLNEIVSLAEDPEKVLEHSIKDMQQEQMELRQVLENSVYITFEQTQKLAEKVRYLEQKIDESKAQLERSRIERRLKH